MHETKILKQVLGKYCEVSCQAINLNKYVIYLRRDVDVGIRRGSLDFSRFVWLLCYSST